MNDLQRIGDNSLIAGGLIAISLFTLQNIFSQSPNETDIIQKYLLVAFAVSLSSLSLWYYVSRKFNGKIIQGKSMRFATALLLLGILSVIVEIGLMIWRYYLLATYVFRTFVTFAIFAYIKIRGGH